MFSLILAVVLANAEPISWCAKFSQMSADRQAIEINLVNMNGRIRMQESGGVINEKTMPCFEAYEKGAASLARKFCTIGNFDETAFLSNLHIVATKADACYTEAVK